MQAFDYCKLPKHYCVSKSVVNIQNDESYCFSWCISALLHENGLHRERVSHFKKNAQRNQVDIHFPMKTEGIPKFKKLNTINNKFFELPSSNDFSLVYVDKNSYKDQIDLLLYKKHCYLITNLQNFQE